MKMRLSPTKDIPNPNEYIQMLFGEYSDWAMDEEAARDYCGHWRKNHFHVTDDTKLDLEIGTGNGFHFAHHAIKHPERRLIGLEVKYKPLIQSIRRARVGGAQNARMIRFNAALLSELFGEGELNNVFIHHPDPWPKKKHWKHRLIQPEFLDMLYSLQRPGSFVEFKTDSRAYYDWALPHFQGSKYEIIRNSTDLHNSPFAQSNFVTHFEKIFISKGVKINYLLLRKQLL
jgi:tRNA (guanine-N7-)-methyltransferase